MVIGLDSLSPVMTERFMTQGALPGLARLRDGGLMADVVSTMPPSTPTAWTAVTTGAGGSTSGIEGFSLHRRGGSFDERIPGCATTHCRVEFLWDVLERAGRLPVVLKFPISWPPTLRHGVQVDGAAGWGGMKCVWDLAYSSCFRTDAAPAAAPAAGPSRWSTRDQDNLDEEAVHRLEPRPSEWWPGQPAEAAMAWEAELALPFRPGLSGPPWHVAGVHTPAGPRLMIAPVRDGAGAFLLGPGEWSGWLAACCRGREGEVRGHFRIKVMELDVASRHCALHVSQIHRADSYTVPAPLAAELTAAVGPFPEWTESYDLLQGWIDHATQLEIYAEHVRWMTDASHWLMKRYDWDLFITQTHIIDMAQHIYWGAIDPAHPEYREADAPRFWAMLEETYRLADGMVASIAASAGPDDLVVVLGDHGQDLYHTTFMTNALLIRLGLLHMFRDAATGAPRIDWRRTKAYAASNHVFVNLRGRDPHGIVPMENLEALCRTIVDALDAVVDPRTGMRPVRFAAPKRAWSAFGLHGEGVGDVIFATARGYQTRSSLHIDPAAWAGERLIPPRVELFRTTRLFRDFTGEHDTSFPLDPAIRTLLFATGPGIPRGRRRELPVRMIDVAPTLAAFLGVAAPGGCEGAAMTDWWREGAPA
jgi:predicted AlkP superfamily phosphohydrolase/phosphomutase